MVSSERSGEVDETVGVRDALARIDQRIDDLRADFNERMNDLRSEVNGRIDDLRAEMDAKLKLLMWGIGIGFAAVLATLGALLARGG
ncbi:MAG: hypothetical protein F4Y95_04260 [Chloroflexi bacterium]|nr:hypothetical protein [Chloroflexota bacterium]MYD54457.1 hypothetical protein [Chloroflexota bacterium]